MIFHQYSICSWDSLDPILLHYAIRDDIFDWTEQFEQFAERALHGTSSTFRSHFSLTIAWKDCYLPAE
jgi:hypothetical protein